MSPIEQLLFAHRWWRDDIDSGLLRLSSMLIVLPTGGAALPPTTTSLDWLTACFAVLHRICYKKQQIPPSCRMKARRLEKAQSPMLYCNHFSGKPVTYFPVTSAIGVYYLSPLHIALWVIVGAPCRALTDCIVQYVCVIEHTTSVMCWGGMPSSIWIIITLSCW